MNTDPRKSATYCGCDEGANYRCKRHQTVTVFDGGGYVTLPREAILDESGFGSGVGFVVKDSGERKTFASGSLRDTTTGKIDYSRALDGPLFERLADHLTKGEAKYPDYAPGKPNWTLISTEEELVRYRKSAVRHFIQWYRGDTDEDHFAATVFNMNGCALIQDKMRKNANSVA